jgi:predicted ATPase
MSGQFDRREARTGRIANFISELRRRRVLSFTAGYIVMAWVTIEVASVVLDAFDVPKHVLQILIIAAIVFAPAAMVLAWFYDLTRHGLVFTDREDWRGSRPDAPEAPGVAATEAGQQASGNADGGADAVTVVPEAAERRLVTVLQCSLSPLGDGSEEQQAECFCLEIPAIARRFGEIVESVEGYLLPTKGEVFTAYFGVQVVHEDDALRAVLSAQRMLRHIADFNANDTAPGALRIEISVGLHCGFAIVAEQPGQAIEQWVSNIGQTLNAAAALQLAAGGSEIRLSADVHAMLHERIPCEPAGSQPLPGSAAPVPVFRVAAAGLRLHAPLPVFRGEMIGREKEIALLEERWDAAMESQGSVVLVRGEPGMGKTRLVARFRETIERGGRARLVTLQCSAYHAHSPLFPVLRYLEQAVPGFNAQDRAELTEQRLATWLTTVGAKGPELPRTLAEMLSHDLRAGGSQVEPGKQKELLLQGLMRIILHDASEQPVFVLLEDLHWADPTSLELLSMLVGQLPSLRVMLLLTTRPGFRAPWMEQSHVHLVNVTRLNRAQSRAIVAAIDRDGEIGEQLAELIVTKADGVPLFVEELARSLLEAARRNLVTGAQDPLTVPNTLQESLAARIQHLGPAKPILQLAAVIGREFSLALLQASAGLPAERVDELTDQLVDRELVHRRGIGEETRYVFRHALIQQAAYGSMLKSQREECHLAVARSMEQEPSLAGESNEVLAYHYGAAAATREHGRKAIGYWLAAAQVAARRSANLEADHFLDSALQQLQRLPEGDERNETELRIQAQRIPVLVALHGYSSEHMAQTSRRALDLCESVRDFDLRFLALFSMCIFDMVGGRHQESHQSALKLARLDAENEGRLAVETEMLLGLTCFFLGRLEEAETHLLAAIASYDREAHGGHAYRYGQDPEIVAMSYLAWVLFIRGETARLATNEGRLLERARSLGHPNSLGFALAWTAWTRIFGDDHQGLAEMAAELRELGAAYGLSSFAVQGLVLEALRQCRLGDTAAGLATLEQSLDAWRGIGSRCFLEYWDVQLAGACLEAGQSARAAEVLARAAAGTEATGERWSESELHRCLARLAQETGDRTSAMTHIRQALDVSEGQKAWGWYLAAACDGAERLAADDPDAARVMLDGALARLSDPATGATGKRAAALRAALTKN